ncbi:conserved oligomeric Golgi complex subunit 2-like [Uranotaenia lowii]|uniref:conserved oligomeric Golgi complex subunit 2-like n=1 Tax=Uranotaenia lowii TaxID=190385 RepID=UPI00247AC0A8|nr:conserved oligomeric Golgi complex subunit 2-like [Uranotaenia lowii]
MSNGRDLFCLPAGPADLCFDKNEFMKKTFSVDEFLYENRNAGSLEIIRDDLGIYLKVLRSAMIELINQDYADFVDLSANLIGLDQQIGGIVSPLEKLKEEILVVKQALEGTMGGISECLEQKKDLRKYKKSLQSLAKAQGALVKLDSLLKPSEGKEQEINPVLLERAALESIQLQFNIKFCNEFLNQEQMQLSKELKNSLLEQIKDYFLKTLEKKDVDGLERCLRIYCTLDECRTAEDVFKQEIVAPYMAKVISESSLQNSVQGLTGIYNQILDFISMNMKNLLALTKKNGKVKGYDFVTNSFWTEVERRMETNMSSIFAPGNPDSFYQKYKCTLEFLERIELIIEDPAEVTAFKAHAQYKSFQVRWNLPVYFQIRFQEIGSNMEKACSKGLDAHKFTAQQISASQFNLLQFSIALTCISNCWQEGIYLPQLFHRFLKLTLQVLSRATTWIDTAMTYEAPADLQEPFYRIKLLATLYSDITNFSRKVPQIVNLIAEKAPPILELTTTTLDEIFFDNRSLLTTKLNRLQTLIVQELLQSSTPAIRQVSDIPRLYRKTNREVPSKCCQYVEQMLLPSRTFEERFASMVGDDRLKEFLANVYGGLTETYLQAIEEVLTSVQKTEESLRRLKNLRAQTTGTASTTSNNSSSAGTTMTDDDKIRLQLQVDVVHFVQEIERIGLARGEIDKLDQLVQLIEEATKIRIGTNYAGV